MSASLKFRLILSVTAIFLICCVPLTRASYIININEVGSDVVTTGSGSLDITDLTKLNPGSNEAHVHPSQAIAGVGPTSATAVDVYSGTSGPPSFGSGSTTFANSGSGPIALLVGQVGQLDVPQNYISGSPLSLATDTYTNQTFATLGLTPGTYTYNWGTGIDADSFTVQIGAAAVPLPAGLWAALLAIPFALIARKRMLTA